MKIVNLTPHTINEQHSGLAFLSMGEARCETQETPAYVIGVPGSDIAVMRTVFGKVVGLPEPTEGTTYIVSRIVKQAIPERDDCVCPGKLIRDEQGRPIGCDGFSL